MELLLSLLLGLFFDLGLFLFHCLLGSGSNVTLGCGNGNVYATDRGLENADLGACLAGLDNAGLVLDADHSANDTADGGDLVAYH